MQRHQARGHTKKSKEKPVTESCNAFDLMSIQFPIPHVNLSPGTLPNDVYKIFRLFVTDDMLKLSADYVNKCVLECGKEKAWKETTMQEIKGFIGVRIYMGSVRLQRATDYWTTTGIFGLHPNVTSTISSIRYDKISSYSNDPDIGTLIRIIFNKVGP